MKQFLIAALLPAILLSLSCSAQSDKSKRPSPPAQVSETTTNGVKITIDYSKPSAKGRTIGKDIAPYGKVWRTGANEATSIELSKNATVEGKALPAGKYGFYTIPGQNEWTIIFNKTWNQWGTNYTEADDALRIKVKPTKANPPAEQMTFSIAKNGTVNLVWADTKVSFTIK